MSIRDRRRLVRIAARLADDSWGGVIPDAELFSALITAVKGG